MAIVNVDAKSLEIHTACFLSQDLILMKELCEEFDLHTDNQTTFILPTRTIAKFFIFRILFGGSAPGFTNDPDFFECKFNKNQWQEVIDKFYNKYKGIAKWHQTLIQTATTTGTLVMPTGRIFHFSKRQNDWGEWKWPETQIKNYPVQSCGADLMMLYRLEVFRQMKTFIGKLVSTVHDSLVIDCPQKEVDKIVEMLYNSASKVPKLFEEAFGVKYNLPFRVECSVGPNMADLTEIKQGVVYAY